MFCVVYSGFCGLHSMRGAGFHFNEAEVVAIPGDEIKFAAATRRAIVAGHDDVPETAQVEVGVFFTATAGALVGREMVGLAAEKCEFVEELEDELSNARRHKISRRFRAAVMERLLSRDLSS